jgi:hypothetical protein
MAEAYRKKRRRSAEQGQRDRTGVTVRSIGKLVPDVHSPGVAAVPQRDGIWSEDWETPCGVK